MNNTTDPVRALIADWRESAAGAKRYSTTDYEDGYAAAESNCANRLEAALAQQPEAPAQEAVAEPGAVRTLVAAANAVLALYPHDDQLWTLELAVRPFNATKPDECTSGCPPQQTCDYCTTRAPQPAIPEELARDAARYRWLRDEAWKVKDMSPAVVLATAKFDVSGPECGGFEYGASLDELMDQHIAQPSREGAE